MNNANVQKDNSAQRSFYIWVLSILAVIAVFVVLMSAGRPVALPWSLDTCIKNGVSAAESTNGGIVSDKYGSRLIFTTANREVTNTIEGSLFDEDQVHYSYVTCNESAAYVIEFTYFGNSGYIQEVRIAKYSLNGERLATIQKFSYNLDDQATIKPPVFGLHIDETQGYVLMSDAEGDDLFVQTFPLDEKAGEEGKVIRLGTLTQGHTISRAEYSSDNEALIVTDDSGNAYKISSLGLSYALVPLDDDATQDSSQKVLNDDDSVNGDSFMSSGTVNDLVLQSSLPRTIGTLLFWIAVLYLVVLFIVVVTRFVLFCLRNDQFERIKRALAFVLALCFAGGITAFYSINIQSVENQDTANAITMTAATTAAGYGTDFANAIAAYKQDGLPGLSAYSEIEYDLEQMSLAAAKTGQGIYFTLVGEGEDGSAVAVMSSSKLTPAGTRLIRSDDQPLTFSHLCEVASLGVTVTTRYDTITALEPIADESGKTVGILSANASASSFDTQSFRQNARLFLILVSLMIALSFVALELGSWIEQLSNRRKLKRLGAPSSEIEFTLTRPIMFLAVAAMTCLSVLLSLITKEMLEGTAWEGNGIIIAIPQMAFTLGMIISAPFMVWLSNRVSSRLILSLAALFGGILCCVSGIGVSMGSMVLMTVAVFAATFCIEIAFIYANKFPLHMKDKTKRAEANRYIATATISGTALAGLTAGPLAEILGNQFVFYLASAFCCVLFVLVLIFFPKSYPKKEPVKKIEKKEGTLANCLAFLTDPMITTLLLCVVVPMAIMYGYKSYLFPLLASQGGMDKAAISSIVVYCYAISYYLNPAISRLEKNIGPGALIVASGFLLSLTFVLFFFNNSLAWAIVALFMFTLTYKMVQPACSTLWQNRTLKIKTSKDAAYTSAFTTEKLAEFTRSPLLGALMTGLGISLLCPLLGVAHGIITTVFAVTLKKKRIAQEQSSAPPPITEDTQA